VTKLVLFDIDGTLLSGDGAARRAFEASLAEVFGTPGDPSVRYDGKTDRQIARELMRGAGFDDAEVDRRLDALVAGYLERLRGEVRAGGEAGAPHFVALPGVAALLDALDPRPDVVLGLLTGNVAGGAAVKLAAAGIDRARFRVNAFGCDAEHRPDLPAVARRRAEEALGAALDGGDVVVVGDTPADVQCARPIGARAVGVATGRYSEAELAEHAPAATLPDFRDTAAAVAAILG
jgi:phosphoglycolate phosphatase-like HAD superfamily hydrolase